jgi:large subunit ribosomal protein L17
MRHKKLNKRLGRNKSNRKQLLRSIVRALFLSYKIETTLAKAKEARKLADRIIKYAKSGSLKDIREIESIMQDRALTSKIIRVLSPLSRDRKGGHTRIIKIGSRRGDGAQLALLELTDLPAKEEKQKKSKKEKPKASDDKTLAKPESGKTDQEKYKGAEKAKEEVVQEKEQAPIKFKKPKPDKKQDDRRKEEPKADKKPEKEKPGPDKKGLMSKFKGFFKKK